MSELQEKSKPLGKMWSELFDDDFKFPSLSDLRIDKSPAVNISQDEKTYTLELAAPGLSKEDFSVKVQDGTLQISAEKKSESESKEGGYTRKEFNYSSFRRSFSLPVDAEEAQIKAKYENGVLRVSLPRNGKAGNQDGRTIDVG